MFYPEYEKLFTLEVLVEQVYISNSSLQLDESTKSNLRETCVTFQFLNNPPLVVCEEDFYKSSPNPNATILNFKIGKSCIFSIRSSLVPTLPYKFDINMNVMRKVGQLDNKILLGATTINLGDSFAALMHSSVAEPDLPLEKIKAGQFDIFDEQDREIGYVIAFIRLSSYGPLIVTQFQVGADQDNLIFKDTEQRVTEIPGDPENIPKIVAGPKYRATRLPEEQRKSDVKSDTGYARLFEEPDTGYGDMRKLDRYKPEEYRMEADYADYERPPTPHKETEEGNYKEIVATIRQYSLHIRLPMKPKKPKEDNIICKKELDDEFEWPVCKYAPPMNLCDCDFPVPPEAVPRCGPL